MPRVRFDTIYHDLKNKILDGTYTYESYLPTEIPAPETPFDVRSHFCPMKLFFSLFTVGAYALFGRKSQVRLLAH